jgi:hypothetical protein
MKQEYAHCSVWVWDRLRDSERSVVDFGAGYVLAGKPDAIKRVVEREYARRVEETK